MSMILTFSLAACSGSSDVSTDAMDEGSASLSDDHVVTYYKIMGSSVWQEEGSFGYEFYGAGEIVIEVYACPADENGIVKLLDNNMAPRVEFSTVEYAVDPASTCVASAENKYLSASYLAQDFSYPDTENPNFAQADFRMGGELEETFLTYDQDVTITCGEVTVTIVDNPMWKTFAYLATEPVSFNPGSITTETFQFEGSDAMGTFQEAMTFAVTEQKEMTENELAIEYCLWLDDDLQGDCLEDISCETWD